MAETFTIEKPKREMTDRKFINLKLSGKMTSEGLLAAHLQFLEGKTYLTDIITAYKDKELLPSPTIQICQSLIFEHLKTAEIAAAKAKLEKNVESYRRALKDDDGNVISSAPDGGKYLVYLMVKKYDRDGKCSIELGTIEVNRYEDEENEKGEIETKKFVDIKPAIWSCETYGEAQNLSDRKLFNREDGVYTEIESQFDEKKVKTRVMRSDAFARILRAKKSPIMKQTSKTGGTFKWHARARNSHSVQPPR